MMMILMIRTLVPPPPLPRMVLSQSATLSFHIGPGVTTTVTGGGGGGWREYHHHHDHHHHHDRNRDGP